MLTPEQVRQYRLRLGLDPVTAEPTQNTRTPAATSAPASAVPMRTPPTGTTPTAPPAEDPQLRIQRLRGETPDVPQDEGIVKSVVRGLVTPFARAGVTAYNLVSGAADMGTAALAKAGGDEQTYRYAANSAADNIEKTRTLPFLGKVKPVGATDNVLEGIKDIAGTGLEIGSTIVGGGEAKGLYTAGKTGLRALGRQAISTGLRYGGTTGAAYNAGQSLQANEGLGDTLKSAAAGFAVGAPLGIASEFAAPFVGKAAKGALRYIKNEAPDVAEQAATKVAGQAVDKIADQVPAATAAPVNGLGMRVRRKLAGLDSAELDTIAKPNSAITEISKKIANNEVDANTGKKLLDTALVKDAARKDQVNSKFVKYLEHAKKSVNDQNIPSAYGLAGEEAEKQLKKLEGLKKTAGKQKGAILEKVKNQSMTGLDTVQSGFDEKIAERMGLTFGKKGDLVQAPGRISVASFDQTEKNIVTKARQVLSQLKSKNGGVSVRKVDDAIDALQSIVESEKALSPVQRRTRAEGIVESVTRDLKKKLYDHTKGTGYAQANQQYAKVLRVYDALNSRLRYDPSLGVSRGDALMKQIFSPSGNTMRGIFKQVEKMTGDNLVDDAILAKLAMKIVGDTRADDLLSNTAGAILEGSSVKGTIIKSLFDQAKRLFADPEKVAKEFLEKSNGLRY